MVSFASPRWLTTRTETRPRPARSPRSFGEFALDLSKLGASREGYGRASWSSPDAERNHIPLVRHRLDLPLHQGPGPRSLPPQSPTTPTLAGWPADLARRRFTRASPAARR